jgi:hypothetical protein
MGVAAIRVFLRSAGEGGESWRMYQRTASGLRAGASFEAASRRLGTRPEGAGASDEALRVGGA